MKSLNNWLIFTSAIVLLGVTTFLGLKGNATEMGLSILAGAIGLAFANIERIRRFKGAGFEAEMWEKVQAIVDKETEVESEPFGEATDEFIDDRKRAVLLALGDPRYTWRYLGGLSRDAGVDKEVANNELRTLVDLGYATQVTGKRGPMWTLTNTGRAILSRYQHPSTNS